MKQKMRDGIDIRVAFLSGARQYSSAMAAVRQPPVVAQVEPARRKARKPKLAARLRERLRGVRRKVRTAVRWLRRESKQDAHL